MKYTLIRDRRFATNVNFLFVTEAIPIPDRETEARIEKSFGYLIDSLSEAQKISATENNPAPIEGVSPGARGTFDYGMLVKTESNEFCPLYIPGWGPVKSQDLILSRLESFGMTTLHGLWHRVAHIEDLEPEVLEREVRQLILRDVVRDDGGLLSLARR